MKPENLPTAQDCKMRINWLQHLIMAHETHLTSYLMTKAHRNVCKEEVKRLRIEYEQFYKQLNFLKKL